MPSSTPCQPPEQCLKQTAHPGPFVPAAPSYLFHPLHTVTSSPGSVVRTDLPSILPSPAGPGSSPLGPWSAVLGSPPVPNFCQSF